MTGLFQDGGMRGTGNTRVPGVFEMAMIGVLRSDEADRRLGTPGNPFFFLDGHVRLK